MDSDKPITIELVTGIRAEPNRIIFEKVEVTLPPGSTVRKINPDMMEFSGKLRRQP